MSSPADAAGEAGLGPGDLSKAHWHDRPLRGGRVESESDHLAKETCFFFFFFFLFGVMQRCVSLVELFFVEPGLDKH